MNRLHLIASLLFIITWPLAEQVSFTDSLTGAKFLFPEGSIITETTQHQFQKCVVKTGRSIISIYSMKNKQKKDGYAWSEIDRFDANNKYGDYIDSERIPIKGVIGWHRLYKKTNSDGTVIFSFVSIIRGNNYVEYLLESAFSKESMASVDVVSRSYFPSKQPPRFYEWQNNNQGLLLIIVLFLELIPFALFAVKKRMSTPFKLALTILATLIGAIASLYSGFWTTFWTSIMLATTWGIILFAFDRWSDVWDFAKKIIESI